MLGTGRNRLGFAVGFVVFLVGAGGAAYVATRADDEGSGRAASSTVLYATGPVPEGMAGSTAVAEGLVKSKAVAASGRPVNALTDPAQLSGRVAASPLRAGDIITADAFPAAQTRIGTVHIPPGKRALAIQLEHVPGVAGFAGAGDRIDVYSVAKGDGGGPAGVRLVMQSVEVLNVNGGGLAPTQGQPGAPNLIFLLAVTPAEAERLIYLSEFERLYFDLVPKGEPAVNTPGSGPGDALRTL